MKSKQDVMIQIIFGAFVFFSWASFANIDHKDIKTPSISKIRQQIGPVYSPPVEYAGKLYFLGSSGALYESDYDQNSVKEIFKTKFRTVTEMLLDSGILYFGDGIHENKSAYLYAFDIAKGKLLFSVPIEGHIEKRPTMIGEKLIVGLGPGGIAAFDRKSGKVIWKQMKVDDKAMHVDSAPIVKGDKIYVSSIYEFKAILCFSAKDGKLIWQYKAERSPKADLILSDSKIISLASEGNLADNFRQEPSDLILLDSENGSLITKKELRGSNYFPQLIKNGEIILSLSTGDVALFDIKSAKLTPIDQYPEPFLASSFEFKGNSCVVSVMGRLFCYKDKKLVSKEQLGEINMGKVSSVINHRVYIPSRAGFAILRE